MSFERVDLTKPKYDQSTYWNRAKHFFLLTNPLNIFASSSKLDRAKRIVEDYIAGKPVPDVKNVDELWRMKYLYESAFHPDTKEKMIVVGRMSAQMPANTFITGGLLTFYKSTPAVIFWQWINQTFNAVVNYTNRAGASPINPSQLFVSYVMATSGALVTALGLNHLTKRANPIIGRLVPLVAISAANCINIPMMRNQEIRDGVPLMDENLKPYDCSSRKAAILGISTVVISRVGMAIPSMFIPPVIVQVLTNNGFFNRNPKLLVPIQMASVAVILVVSTPMGCAFFSQIKSIEVSSLEEECRTKIRKINPNVKEAWFNKGL